MIHMASRMEVRKRGQVEIEGGGREVKKKGVEGGRRDRKGRIGGSRDENREEGRTLPSRCCGLHG